MHENERGVIPQADSTQLSSVVRVQGILFLLRHVGVSNGRQGTPQMPTENKIIPQGYVRFMFDLTLIITPPPPHLFTGFNLGSTTPPSQKSVRLTSNDNPEDPGYKSPD